MKNKLSILLLTTIGLLNAQTQKVGINKENPQHDVDVQGTMKIRDLSGTISETSIPLGWNPQNNQVVKLSENNEKPFYKLEYRLRLDNAGFDVIKDLNTYIDGDKYYAIVTQSTLTMEHSATSNQDNEQTALIGLVSQYGDSTEKRDLAKKITPIWFNMDWGDGTGKFAIKDQNKNLNNDPKWFWQQDWNRRDHDSPSTVPIPDIRVESKRATGAAKPTLHLSADYPHTSPVVGSNADHFIWYISFLIINKKLVAEGGNQAFNFN